MLVIKESIKLKRSAHQKLLTWNSSISLSAMMIIMALMTRRKKPSVKKVIGIVKIVKIGLTTAFKKAKTTATIKALTKLSIAIPGSNFAVITTAIADTKILVRNFTTQK